MIHKEQMSREKVTRSITLLPNDFSFPFAWIISGCARVVPHVQLASFQSSAVFQRTITNQTCLWAIKTQRLNISALLNKVDARHRGRSPTVNPNQGKLEMSSRSASVTGHWLTDPLPVFREVVLVFVFGQRVRQMFKCGTMCFPSTHVHYKHTQFEQDAGFLWHHWASKYTRSTWAFYILMCIFNTYVVLIKLKSELEASFCYWSSINVKQSPVEQSLYLYSCVTYL